jgi:hypothetical protein
MSNYRKMLDLFEKVKDSLTPKDLQYALDQISEYESCVRSEEVERVENGLIIFCEKKLAQINK